MTLKILQYQGGLKLKGASNNNDQALEGVDPPLPSHCFSMLLSGVPGSGKTSLLISLLTNPRAYKKKFSKIYLFSPSISTLPDDFVSKLNQTRIHPSLDALPEVLKEIDGLQGTGEKALIIMDDLVKELQGDYKREVLNLLNNRRHRGSGVCVALVTQKLRSIPLAIRSACDSVFFFSLQNKRECNDVFDDCLSSLCSKEEYQEVLDCCKGEKHCFIFADTRNGRLYRRFDELVFDE
jgi:hypothetical protein